MKKAFIIILLNITIIFSCYTQNSINNIDIIKKNNYIILTNVSINNNDEKYNFLFDTGSSISSISKHIANLYHIHSNDSIIMNDGIKRQFSYTSKVSISFDDIDIENIKVDIFDFSKINFTRCYKIDGIIGGNIIKEFVWKLTKDSLIITKKIKHINTKNYSKFKLKLSSNTPIIIAGFKNDYNATMLFDTGNNCLADIDINNIKYIDIKDSIKGNGTAYESSFSNCSKDIVFFRPKTDFTLYTKLSIHNICSNTNYDNFLSNSIGNKLLNYFDIILDYKKHRIYFKQNRFNYKQEKVFGFKWNIDEHKNVFISFLWKNSPAEKLGLTVGQQILRINDLDLTDNNLDLCQLYDKINEVISSNSIIQIWINNNSKKYILTKTFLLN